MKGVKGRARDGELYCGDDHTYKAHQNAKQTAEKQWGGLRSIKPIHTVGDLSVHQQTMFRAPVLGVNRQQALGPPRA